MHSKGERSTIVVGHGDPEFAQAVNCRRHGAKARALVTVEGDITDGEGGDRWDESHHGASEPTVDCGVSLESHREYINRVGGVTYAVPTEHAQVFQCGAHQVRVA